MSNWEKITTNAFVLQCIRGVRIHFESKPFQKKIPRVYNFDKDKCLAINKEIQNLLEKRAIVKINSAENCFVSNIFTRQKPNGDYRVIIDLSDLNKNIKKEKFKMDSIQTVISMMKPDGWMASIDLKDAYLTIPMAEVDQNYLVFQWNDCFYKYIVLPFGLSISPRVFTKVLKPIISKFREQGFTGLTYLDDSFLIENSKEKCIKSVDKLSQDFENLGFIVNKEKSSFEPKQEMKFLGYLFNTVEMTIKPDQDKREKTIKFILDFLKKDSFPVRLGASLIGTLNDLCKAIEYGWAHTKYLEIDKIKALRAVSWDGNMHFSKESYQELQWWLDNLGWREKKIRITPPSNELFCDASDQGYGGVLYIQNEKKEKFTCNNRWSIEEADRSINIRELEAVYFCLLSFERFLNHEDLMIYSDNVTTVAHIRKMGSVRSIEANIIAKKIWALCEKLEIFIWITHKPGSENIEADAESRIFSDDTEWMLNKDLFNWGCEKWGKPDLDLFASRHNFQCKNYVSWIPDPNAKFIDAFSLDWSKFDFIYLFPPFRLMTRCLQKVRKEANKAMIVCPAWWGQPWASQVHQLASDILEIKAQKGNLVRNLTGKDNYPDIESCPLWLTLYSKQTLKI